MQAPHNACCVSTWVKWWRWGSSTGAAPAPGDREEGEDPRGGTLLHQQVPVLRLVTSQARHRQVIGTECESFMSPHRSPTHVASKFAVLRIIWSHWGWLHHLTSKNPERSDSWLLVIAKCFHKPERDSKSWLSWLTLDPIWWIVVPSFFWMYVPYLQRYPDRSSSRVCLYLWHFMNESSLPRWCFYDWIHGDNFEQQAGSRSPFAEELAGDGITWFQENLLMIVARTFEHNVATWITNKHWVFSLVLCSIVSRSVVYLYMMKLWLLWKTPFFCISECCMMVSSSTAHQTW